MGAPQPFGQRIAFAGRNDVGTFGDRTVGKFAVALDAACAVEPARAADARKGTPESEHHGAEQSQQQHRMHRAGNQGEEPDQRENHAHAEDAHARPHRRPDPLPKHDQPRNRYEALGPLAARFPI